MFLEVAKITELNQNDKYYHYMFVFSIVLH